MSEEEVENRNPDLIPIPTKQSYMFLFKLTDDFVESYRSRSAPFGYRDAGGNSVGEITFLRTYSRLKEDGNKETWSDVCERVINGMYSLQKDHCKKNRLPWNDAKAQASAKEAFDRLFNLKWTPPGRGLWAMGTDIVNVQKNSAALQNCAFVSTAEMNKFNPAKPFAFLMEASMLGVGVGFDDKGADKDFIIYEPKESISYVIPDTREGWVESMALLLNSYLKENQSTYNFDYSLIRPSGTPIKTFGGVAAGHEPLERLHDHIRKMFNGRKGDKLTRIDIADIGNVIGVCVVSGNVRRSAELLIGRLDDQDFLNLKNSERFPERNSYDSSAPGWGWMSNNSIETVVGADLSSIVEGISLNGEPGVLWMDMSRKYGRLADPPNNKDHRVAGYNPSLVPGTKIYTTDGIVTIEELEGKQFTIKNLNGEHSPAKCWKSGVDKPVYSVNLVGGWSYSATAEHKWPVWDEDNSCWEKKNTLDIKPGDKLRNLPQSSLFPQGTRGTYEEGFLIGWNLGDGWQTDRKDGRRQYGFMVSEADRESGIHTKLTNILTSLGVITEMNTKDEINVSHHSIRDLFDAFGVKHKTEGLPEGIWHSDVSDDFRRGLIDALISADGSVTISDNRLCFSQASEIMVNDVASLLGFFGIKTNKQIITRSRHEAFPDAYEDDGKTFTRYVIRIGDISNIKTFVSNFSLSRLDKQKKIIHLSSKDVKKDTSWYIKVESVVPDGTSDVWDITVYDETHAFQLDHCITGNCAEQSLESYECCVSGDTLIQTQNGISRIEDLVNKPTSVWNGKAWSEVTPFFTGDSALFRVTLSDGSYLDVTAGHEWSVRNKTERTFKRLTTSELQRGMYLPEFSLDSPNGIPNADAYKWGWFAGDGYIDQGRYAMALVQESEASVVVPLLSGVEYVTQSNHSGNTKFSRVNITKYIPFETARSMRQDDTLPNEIYNWDVDSLSNFFGGWIDSDGSLIQNNNTDHYLLYGSEGKLREAQILLRRIGVNHSTLRQFGSKGDVTNLGTRNQDLYRLLIPSYEAHYIKTALKCATRFGSRTGHNNAYGNAGVIDRARKQKIISVEKISNSSPTFCFTEPEVGMGVFGNALTYQCTLVETYLNRHDSLEDYKRTLKFAYLYAKTVTLLPTHWEETNAIMQRNRRIGASMSGVANFADRVGVPALREWMDQGYKTIQRYDNVYSEWLGIRESIKMTTIKPSGTVSILAGESPGVHWTPGGKYFNRTIRFSNEDPMLPLFRMANYRVEPAAESPNTTSVVYFPIKSDAARAEKDVTIFEKMSLAATAQRYWSDNSVSVTISFNKDTEADHVGTVLHMYDGQLKTVSFLPSGNDTYPQMPYTQITEEEYVEASMSLFQIDLTGVYAGMAADAIGERYCTTSTCEIKFIIENQK